MKEMFVFIFKAQFVFVAENFFFPTSVIGEKLSAVKYEFKVWDMPNVKDDGGPTQRGFRMHWLLRQ